MNGLDAADAAIAKLHTAGLNDGEIADKTGMGRSTVRERRAKLGLPPQSRLRVNQEASPLLDLPKAPSATTLSQPPSAAPIPDAADTCTDWLQLDGDRAVISDLHIPYHDADVLRQWADEAARLGIRRFLIVGDLMDANQFSKRGKMLGRNPDWMKDVDCATAMFAWLLERFEGGEMIVGNHDEWVEAHYRGMVDSDWYFERMLKTDGRVKFSRFEQCELRSGGKLFRVLHGANYSGANPLGVAQRLSAKFGCSIIMGHQHHACEGRDWSGVHQCVCLGCAADPDRLLYIHKAPRTNPAQTQGFAMVKDGWARSYRAGEPIW